MNPSELLRHSAHRPWTVPQRPWIMEQIWRDLLFAHWSVPVSAIRPLVPAQLELDTFGGEAWLSITPFHMSIRFRGFPIFPAMAHVPELNCRTYVTARGKPGIFFFSLDIASRAAAWGARTFYHLPYFAALMRTETQDAVVEYLSCRGPALFRGRYAPISPAQETPGNIRRWLAERYCLYSVWRGGLYRGEIHHLPWPLQDASAEITENTLPEIAGIQIDPAHPRLLNFARELQVLIWPLERVKST